MWNDLIPENKEGFEKANVDLFFKDSFDVRNMNIRSKLFGLKAPHVQKTLFKKSSKNKRL